MTFTSNSAGSVDTTSGKLRVLIPQTVALQGTGSGIFTTSVAQELVRAGHEVLVIAPDHKPVPTEEYGFPVRR